MGALDQITQMKNQGMSENEILNKLQEQRIPPKEINDALNQSKIKDAVSNPPDAGEMEPSIMQKTQTPQMPTPIKTNKENYEEQEIYIPQQKTGASQNPPTQGYSQNYQAPQQEQSTQDYQEQSQNYQAPQQEQSTQDYQEQSQNYQEPQDYSNQGAQGDYQQNFPAPAPSEEYYPQEGYENYGNSGGFDTDTMIEISEQVFSEKIRKIQKQLEELEGFKVISETKINNSSERLKRIEASIDKLQMAILEKVGSYGRGLESIKKEMSMMQNSFSKVLPSIVKHHTTPPSHSSHPTHHAPNQTHPVSVSTSKKLVSKKQLTKPISKKTMTKSTTKTTIKKKPLTKKVISKTRKKDDLFSF